MSQRKALENRFAQNIYIYEKNVLIHTHINVLLHTYILLYYYYYYYLIYISFPSFPKDRNRWIYIVRYNYE